MRPCPSCGCHVREAEPSCPHCSARAEPTIGRTTLAVLLGLSLVAAGCPDTQSDYGSPTTDAVETDDDTGTAE